MMRRKPFFVLLFVFLACVPASAQAQDNADIQAQIDSHNAQISSLEKEIAGYQKQLDSLSGQHQTLASAVKALDVSRAQTTAKIKVTQNKIADANLELTRLGAQIGDKETAISLEKQVVAQSLRSIKQADEVPVIEQLLSSQTLADAWQAVDEDAALTDALRSHSNDLADAKVALTGRQAQVNATKKELSTLNAELVTQQKQLDVSRQAEAALLAQTQNQEAIYQQLIATKKAQQAAFEAELSNLQSQLTSVGSVGIPHVGSGVLSWPYSAAFAATCKGKAAALGNAFCITQYFGNTPFATANAQIYNGNGHDAIDIGMPIGTPILSAAAGTVLATGNTDIRSPSGAMCYSFGKWVMVQHNNGLSTLYAHLSTISVSKGQTVGAGSLLGYSGMTGYATGPHLHFGVYVSSGVQIMDLGKWRGSTGTPCTSAGAVIPVAPRDAYLNPMSYL